MSLAPSLAFQIKDQNFLTSTSTDREIQILTETPTREVYIKFPNSTKYLLLKAEKSINGYWTATSNEFSIYGDGISFNQAVLDFIIVLKEYYEELIAEKVILGPFLKKELAKLQHYIN